MLFRSETCYLHIPFLSFCQFNIALLITSQYARFHPDPITFMTHFTDKGSAQSIQWWSISSLITGVALNHLLCFLNYLFVSLFLSSDEGSVTRNSNWFLFPQILIDWLSSSIFLLLFQIPVTAVLFDTIQFATSFSH